MHDNHTTPGNTDLSKNRLCSKCAVFKPITEFHKASNNRSGLAGQCKQCASEQSLAWHKRKKEELNKQSRKVQKEHEERIREYKKEWRKNNRDKNSVYCQNRRVQKRGGDGNITSAEWESMLTLYKGKCAKCGSAKNIHMDHVVPLSRGGSHSIDNVQPLCQTCNLSKGTQVADYRRQ